MANNLVAKKSKISNTFGGPVETVYGLCDHGSWKSIILLEQKGKSLQNQWGGYSCRNTGQPKYIDNIWKNL